MGTRPVSALRGHWEGRMVVNQDHAETKMSFERQFRHSLHRKLLFYQNDDISVWAQGHNKAYNLDK